MIGILANRPAGSNTRATNRATAAGCTAARQPIATPAAKGSSAMIEWPKKEKMPSAKAFWSAPAYVMGRSIACAECQHDQVQAQARGLPIHEHFSPRWQAQPGDRGLT